MKPVRLQRSRRKGATLVSPNGLPVVYCGRGSPWGNPYPSRALGQQWACDSFRRALERGHLSFTAAAVRRKLRGKNLCCWCKLSDACHVDVLLEIANSPESP